MKPSAAIYTLPLRCDSCAHELHGLEFDEAYLCPLCHRVWELEKQQWRSYPAYTVAPPAVPTERLLYLPYWVFELDSVSFETKESRKLAKLEKLAKFLKRLYIEAYNVFMGSTFGRLSPSLTLQQFSAPLQPASQVVGISLASHKLIARLRYYLLAAVDQKVDVTDVEPSFQVKDRFLLAYPFYLRERNLVDAFFGVELVHLSVFNLESILSYFGYQDESHAQ